MNTRRPRRLAAAALSLTIPLSGTAVAQAATTAAEKPAAATASSPDTTTNSTRTVAFHGMTIDAKVADHLKKYAKENNLDLGKEFSETPVATTGESTLNSPTFYANSRGDIEVPPEYVYNPDSGGLHDYCTNSPDQFPAPGENADFSGACAKHDLCYENTNRNDKNGMRTCDSNLRNDLIRVCESVYTSHVDPRRSACQSTALGYYGAVVAFHHENYMPG
ncbi:phospholipase A2 [Corynebacterium bovis]|uniref:phospholipase A2 n=1 Tax=Corynebacterium bovis TaxID=36808 RepID=UPI000F64DA57|nr:phospholipase A2 [Corynebacterium bovis]RRQ14101.1 hypothetical protein CXF46_11080 [Corynebacterium bovis]